MKSTGAWLLGCWLACVLVTPALGGDSLTVRLIEASNTPATRPLPPDLEMKLKNNLPGPYRHFNLIDIQQVRLPANDRISLGGLCQLSLNGPQHKLAVGMVRQQQRIISMTVSLQDNKPLVVGGFPSLGGKYLVVLTAH